MNRRELIQHSAALGLTAAGSLAFRGALAATRGTTAESTTPRPLTPPASKSIPVAFLISEGAVVIDFCGPWEVFERVSLPNHAYDAFSLYTVAESAAPIRASGGPKIVPTYTIANAPAPKVIVIPAQSPASEKTKAWIRDASKSTDVTMSVCTGAFVLASTGLLSGKPATTHHGAYADLAAQYPDIRFSAELASLRLATSPAPAVLLLVWISPCGLSNATSARRWRAKQPTCWSIRAKVV